MISNGVKKNKIKLGIIFGGRSGEHEVSIVSANSIINNLDKSKYQIYPIAINKKGEWHCSDQAIQKLKKNNFSDKEKIFLPADPTMGGLIKFKSNKIIKLDVVFPVLHGTYGEDGTIQGLLELADLAYVGAGVAGSAIGMDKVIQKKLFENEKLPIVKYFYFTKNDWVDNKNKIIKQIESLVKFPCFIKPANLGSSVGISKVKLKNNLARAINLALRFDQKILVEKSVEMARELECAVFGNDKIKTSVVGEIISSNEFYDYDAKYIDGKSECIIPAQIPIKISGKIKKIAAFAYKIASCQGMARIDFLLAKNGEIYLNEINTIPGFTAVSMYPKLWLKTGLSYKKLIDELIELALRRQQSKKQLKTSYDPKNKWYF